MKEMFQKYQIIKRQYPGHLVLARVGDYLEAFNADAEKLADGLNLPLVSRKIDGTRYPMAGFPFLEAEANLNRLIKAGHKVALLEPYPDTTWAMTGAVQPRLMEV